MGLQIVKETDSVYPVVIREIIEFAAGGGTLRTTELPTTLDELKEGTPVKLDQSTGYVHVVKTAKVHTLLAAAGTALRVYKDHTFVAGDFICNGSASVLIDSINTTGSASYDTITLNAAFSAVLPVAANTILYAAASATTNAATASTAVVEDIVAATLTLSEPNGLFNGITVTINANSGDTLAVTFTKSTETLLIRLANSTPGKNTAALCQAAIRALLVTGLHDFTMVTCAAGGTWDAAAIGGVLTSPTDVFENGVAAADVAAKYEADGLLLGNHQLLDGTTAIDNVLVPVVVRGSVKESLCPYYFGTKQKTQLSDRIRFI